MLLAEKKIIANNKANFIYTYINKQSIIILPIFRLNKSWENAPSPRFRFIVCLVDINF